MKNPPENQVFPYRVKENNFAKETASMKHSNSSEKREPGKQTKPSAEGSSSEEEHMEDALALGADEGRDKLRKAAGSCK